MLRKFKTLKTGVLAAALVAGALFLAPSSSFAAEQGHAAAHDRGRAAVQHFDRGRQADRGHMRVNRGFDRGRDAFFGGVVVTPVPEYVPVPEYGYHATAPAPGYAVPTPGCNAAPYGY
ncbi:MAG: hypothetical protein ACRD4O_11190 [Bryobacteraceae bacterium]